MEGIDILGNLTFYFMYEIESSDEEPEPEPEPVVEATEDGEEVKPAAVEVVEVINKNKILFALEQLSFKFILPPSLQNVKKFTLFLYDARSRGRNDFLGFFLRMFF
jgi:hypothetical protein